MPMSAQRRGGQTGRRAAPRSRRPPAPIPVAGGLTEHGTAGAARGAKKFAVTASGDPPKAPVRGPGPMLAACRRPGDQRGAVTTFGIGTPARAAP
jgi:hypothetical protein